MKIRSLLFGFLFSLGLMSFGQVTQVGEGGQLRSHLGPVFGDTVGNAYGRFAYVYPRSTLGSIEHNDSITAIAFKHAASAGFFGPARMRIFIRTTDQSDLGGSSLNWLQETRNGMVLVYDSSSSSITGSQIGFTTFTFNRSPYYRYDTTGGKVHLQVLVEFTHPLAQTQVYQSFHENTTTVPELTSMNGTKYVTGHGTPDSICGASTLLRPTMRLIYPRSDEDLVITDVFTTQVVPVVGRTKVPVLAEVINVGKKAVNNKAVIASISGANSQSDTLYINLDKGSTALLRFDDFKPVYPGQDQVSVKVNESQGVMNTAQLVRTVDYNRTSHLPLSTISNTYRNSANTQAEFAVRFYSKGLDQLKQVRLRFNSSGATYRLMVWGTSASGSPNSTIYQSPDFTTSPGTVTHELSGVMVSGSFFVGVVQTSSASIEINTSQYRPLIPQHFFYRKSSTNSWIDYSKISEQAFFVEALLQPAHDLQILSVDEVNANDSFVLFSSDSMQSAFTITNKGYQSFTGAGVRLTVINLLDSIVYSDTISVDVPLNDTSTFQFKPIAPDYPGRLRFRVEVLPQYDDIVSNNTGELILTVAPMADLAVSYVFEPLANDTIDMLEESFNPVVRVINLGIAKAEDVPVYVNITQGEYLMHSDTQFVTLAPGFSSILFFDTVYLTRPGNIELSAEIRSEQDTFNDNDRFVVPLFGRVLRDVSVEQIVTPKEHDRYLINTSHTPTIGIRNNGTEDQQNFLVKARLLFNGVVVYRDSVVRSLDAQNEMNVNFSTFNLGTTGVYHALFHIAAPDDQWSANDTMMVEFRVVRNNDLEVINVVVPSLVQKEVRGRNPAYPAVIISNPGFVDADQVPVYAMITDQYNDTVYRDTLDLNIAAGTSLKYQFNKLFHFDQWGTYQIHIHHANASEWQFDSRDSFTGQFVISNRNDLSIEQILTPNTDTIELHDLVNVKVAIRNSGIDVLQQIELNYEIRNDSGELVLSDTLYYSELVSEEIINLQADTFFRPERTGRYTITVNYPMIDDSLSNNELDLVFDVVKSVDLGLGDSLFPQAMDSLYIKTMFRPFVRIDNLGVNDVQLATVECKVLVGDDIIYQNAKLVDLEALGSMILHFDSTLLSDTAAEAIAIYSIIAQDDDYPENDSLVQAFSFVEGSNTGSIESVSEHHVKVYPNPVHSIFRVVADSKIDRVIIRDLNGRVVHRYAGNWSEYELELRGSPGLYFVEIQMGKESLHLKLIKQ